MNHLPLDSKSKEKAASTQAKVVEPTHGLAPSSDHMATTLSQPTPPYTIPPSPYEFRPHLPPLVPAAPRPCVPTSSFSHVPASPTTSLSSSASRFRTRGPHINTQPALVGDNSASPGQPRRLSGEENLIDGSSIAPHGAKRQLRAQAPHSMSNVNSLTPQAPFFSEGRSGPSNTAMPMPAPNRSIPPLPSIAPSAPGFPSTAAYSRIKLHLRQHPRAARAGPDGKDRRTIDPPPVLQLLIDDLDLDTDMRSLRAHDWVVHAKLVSAGDPREDLTTVASQTDSGNGNDKKPTRLLLGTTVSSPFFCSDDPDPENAPRHPRSKPSPPPSPSMRFIKTSNRTIEQVKDPEAYKNFPGAFFIFADLSVRKAGQYRLEFTLMKMDPSVLVPGGIVPALSVVVSDVFNVVNAKDFDQVQPSTNLVRGLLDRGAGFPLKLKKGLREGQRRRVRGGDSDAEEEEGEEEEEEANSQDEDGTG